MTRLQLRRGQSITVGEKTIKGIKGKMSGEHLEKGDTYFIDREGNSLSLRTVAYIDRDKGEVIATEDGSVNAYHSCVGVNLLPE